MYAWRRGVEVTASLPTLYANSPVLAVFNSGSPAFDFSAYLAALTGADPIVVPGRFVLTYKAGLVDARWRRWGGRARDQQVLSGARAFGLYGYRGKKVWRFRQMKCFVVKTQVLDR